MKTLDLICGEMNQLNGANRVTEKIVYGYEVFINNGIQLRSLCTHDAIQSCSSYVSKLGEYSFGYSKKEKIIQALKKIPIYKWPLLQIILNNRWHKFSSDAVKKYKSQDKLADCILFNDVDAAFYYFKKVKRRNEKTVFLTHIDKSPNEQLLISRPYLNGSRILDVYNKRFEYVVKNVDSVITICNSARTFIKENYGVDSYCIYNGIEDCKEESIKNFQNRKKKCKFVILGSVIFRKGHDILVDSISQMEQTYKEQIEIHIIGDGSNLSQIYKKVNENGLSNIFVFHGLVQNVEYILKEMDIMILPSRAEGVPIAIIEGLRAGLPIIATDVGEIKNMIEGCGILISLNIKSIKESIIYMIDHKDKVKTYSTLARRRYEEKFTLENMITSYSKIINQLFC